MFGEGTKFGWKRIGVLSTAVFVTLLGGVVLAGPASAHDNTMNTPTTVCDSSTGTYTITYTGQGDYDLASTVTLVSASPAGTTVTPHAQTIQPVKLKGGAYSDPFTLVQTGVPGTAHSASISVDEVWTDGYSVPTSGYASNLAGNCKQTTTAGSPTFTDDVCHSYAPTGASYTIPATTGVVYKINGHTVAAGTYPATDGSTITITAEAAPGYTLTGKTTFTHTFGSQPVCTTGAVAGAPSFTEDVCHSYAPAGASYTIPTTTGVIYKINGAAVAAGTYPATDASTITITAVAAPGYTLSGTTSFTHTFGSQPICTTGAVAAAPSFTEDVCKWYAPTGAGYTIPSTTGVIFQINGVVVAAGTYPATDASTITITAVAAPGYTLSGTTTFTHTFGAQPTCTTTVVPATPSFTEDACSEYAPAGASYTIPSTTGVIYKINGVVVAAGTYPASDGDTVTITAVAAKGYTLSGTTSFTHTFGAQPTCTTGAVAGTPSFTDDVCTNFAPAGAGYTIPSTTGVIYKINGVVVAAGTYPATDGDTVTITAVAAKGYTLSGTTTFTHTFASKPSCASGLAFTGTSTSVPLTAAIGAGLLALGAVLLAGARRLGRRAD